MFDLSTATRLAHLAALLTLASGASLGAADPDPRPDGDATIRAAAGDSEIVIRTTTRLAGAIDSLTYDGREFIDTLDHGRQLQSASNFDVDAPFTPETFNPTEAGSRRDHTGPTSTSRLLHKIAGPHWLQTTTQMAFWLAPDELSFGNPAKNTTKLSNHLLTKRVTIGHKHLEHVIRYDVCFHLPLGERHTYAQFEAVTGYMPPDFARFWAFEPSTGTLEPLSDGPGEQPRPVVLATENGQHAMGVYSPDQPSPGFEHAGYGRFRFQAERVVKWNCVFRLQDRQHGIAPGDYHFRNFVIVGDLETVRRCLVELHRLEPPRNAGPDDSPSVDIESGESDQGDASDG